MTTVIDLLGNPATVGVWSVVPDESTIRFKAKSMWGLLPVKGRFEEFSGDGQISDAGTVFGRIDIKAASLETGIRKRDDDLRSAKFFEVDKHADISVVVTSAQPVEADTVDLRAQLTVKTTTAPLTLPVKVTVLSDDTVRLATEATINRRDFGVDGNMMGMIADSATISGDIVFRRASG
jgi:polyisoprenoid-binding protein YceI